MRATVVGGADGDGTTSSLENFLTKSLTGCFFAIIDAAVVAAPLALSAAVTVAVVAAVGAVGLPFDADVVVADELGLSALSAGFSLVDFVGVATPAPACLWLASAVVTSVPLLDDDVLIAAAAAAAAAAAFGSTASLLVLVVASVALSTALVDDELVAVAVAAVAADAGDDESAMFFGVALFDGASRSSPLSNMSASLRFSSRLLAFVPTFFLPVRTRILEPIFV